MKTAIINRTIWNEWKNTTRFIVDSYHYNNHRASDQICRTWCNPAPQDGSAPNLVSEQIDKHGNTVKVREFNTEACEQLNAWLGGYESILKCMTVEKLNWFLHVMLFYHVKHVLAKMNKPSAQNFTADEEENNEDSDDDESSSYTDVSQVLSGHEDEESSDESENENIMNSANDTEKSSVNDSKDESGENESSESGENKSSESDEVSAGESGGDDSGEKNTDSDICRHLSD